MEYLVRTPHSEVMGVQKVSELPEAAWAAIGAGITGIGMLVAGLVKAKTDTRLGMTKEQRLMLESVFAQVQTQTATINSLHKSMNDQRDYYEARIDELRVGYRKEIADQDVNCQRELAELRSEIQRLNLKMVNQS